MTDSLESSSAKNIPTMFMGSPQYAASILEGLMASGFNVISVITQPDKRVGRGKKIQSPPVKIIADKFGIPCSQPGKLNSDEFKFCLFQTAPQLILVAAYGKILRKSVLDFPKYGCINVHASLLPRWRGASPVQAAILHGDTVSGVTIMKMDEGIDTGDIISSKSIPVKNDDTAGSLMKEFATIGANLLIKTLPGYIRGTTEPKKQPEIGATYAGLMKKSDGRIDFSDSADEIERMIRAYDPWPIAYFEWDQKNVKVFCAEVLSSKKLDQGKRGIINSFPCVGTATNDLKLVEIQTPGKNRIHGKVFLNGARNWSS